MTITVKDAIIKDVLQRFNFASASLVSRYLRGIYVLNADALLELATAMLYKVMDDEHPNELSDHGLCARWDGYNLTLAFCTEQVDAKANDYPPDLSSIMPEGNSKPDVPTMRVRDDD